MPTAEVETLSPAVGRQVNGLPGSIELFTEEKTTMIPHEPLSLLKPGLGKS